MISLEKAAKITDFGLVRVVSELPTKNILGVGSQGKRYSNSGQTLLGTGFGTPTHMAPEQFDNAAGCDERSDIYSFGIILYQMAKGGQLPFPVTKDTNWQGMQRLHQESLIPRLNSPLFPIIQRCLEKSPGMRYPTFKEVRKDLEPLLQNQTGEVIIPPQSKELEVWEWSDKGSSLDSLSRVEEAIRCFDQALDLDPRYMAAWTNKGNSLRRLGRHDEAIRCLDKALELDPLCVTTWNIKGICLDCLGRYKEAISCYDQAMELDPHDAAAWNNKGSSLNDMGRYEEAIRCLDKALELDPRCTLAWYNKGNSLYGGWRFERVWRYEQAITCYDKALKLDPRYVKAWYNKALSEDYLSHLREAAHSYEQFLALDPAQYPDQIEHARKRLRELRGK